MLAIRNKPLQIRTIDDIFNEFFKLNVDTTDDVKTPIHDVIENDKEYIVELLLAGIKKENVSINVEKDELSIKAERKEIENLNYNRKQSYYGKYERTFILPDTVDKENIDASMEDGILKIIIPKIENQTKLSKTIEIK